MKIKKIRAKNFLSVGEQGIEIDFTQYGNIVNIKGSNIDAGPGCSNGAGKTTTILAIIYALYGKLVKGLTHKDVINIKNKKGLEVELWWDDYRVLRKRSPDRLHLWKGEEEISLGGMPATEDLIKNIIGLSYNSFVNVSYFGQHNLKAFLSCDPAEKRQIAENLLSLDKYLKFGKIAKEKLKTIKDKNLQLTFLYKNALQQVDGISKKQMAIISQQKSWRDGKKKEIFIIEEEIKKLSNKINLLDENQDLKAYESAQKELEFLEEEIGKREKNRMDIHALLVKADMAAQQRNEEKQELSIELSSKERELTIIVNEIMELEKTARDFSEKKGGTCPECYGEISEKNVKTCTEHIINKIKSKKSIWNEVENKKLEVAEKLEKCEAGRQKITAAIKEAREKEITNINVLTDLLSKKKEISKIKKPDSLSEVVLLQKDLQHLSVKLSVAREDMSNNDPYQSMLLLTEKEMKSAHEQVANYRKEIQAIEGEIPYYEFWVKGFGDSGIRAFVIDEIIPALNARVNYWLQFLMDGRMKLTFDNQLDEKIERVPVDCDQFVYNSLCGGEHCRIDLAISQAFAHVMMVTSGTAGPSICCLDEVGANIDRPGIHAVYKMICELARERQVIVITHDPDLLDLLSGHDTIEVKMEGGFTTIKK